MRFIFRESIHSYSYMLTMTAWLLFLTPGLLLTVGRIGEPARVGRPVISAGDIVLLPQVASAWWICRRETAAAAAMSGPVPARKGIN
jgi:hypothetical protein